MRKAKVFILLASLCYFLLFDYNLIYGSKYLLPDDEKKQVKKEQKLYTFSFKEMPLTSIFRILSNENVDFIYERVTFQQQAVKQEQQQQQQPQPQPSIQPRLFEQPFLQSTFMPVSVGNQSTVQRQQITGISELDNILITLNLSNVTLDEAVSAICLAGDISCERIAENKYLIKKFQTYTIDIGIYFDDYTINMKPGLGSTGGGGGNGSGLDMSDNFQFNEKIENLHNDIKSLLTSEGKIVYSKRGVFYVIDRPSAIKRIAEFLRKEKEQNQPMKLSVKIVEVTLNDNFHYGIDWSAFFTHLKKKGAIELKTNTQNLNKGISFTFDSNKFDLIFKALSEYGNVRIVRDWTVNSRMGLPVILADVQSIPYLTETLVPLKELGTGLPSEPGITTNVNFIDVGIKISIVGNKIRQQDESFEGLMQVSISSLISIENLRTPDNPYRVPHVRSSSVIVPLSVKFGEMFLLSGFKVDRQAQSFEGIPVLSRIPIIGNLFGYNKKEKTNSEFLILIEPIKH